jgi:hypothetical protein
MELFRGKRAAFGGERRNRRREYTDMPVFGM